ncbi:cornifin-B-like isoform X3 [Erinaceus europaeus]|uniref:Cornifin-B-like isoform X3 n=1 Tax=Erinaceus europaeus TaxID=9365 RepID=A0ABM3Y7B7_ERIEU|nr:cornifin-B-like isoform X3 [Erinaceus europaeus]
MSSYQQKQTTIPPPQLEQHQVKQPCQPPPQQPPVPCVPDDISDPGQTKVPLPGIKVPLPQPIKPQVPHPVDPHPGIKVPLPPQPVNPQVPHPGTKVPVPPTPVVTPGPGQQKTKQK